MTNSIATFSAQEGALTAVDYIKRVVDTSPIAYWPLFSQVASKAWDVMNLGHGTPSNVTPGATGIGDGRTAFGFNGSTSVVNIYTAALAAAFNARELTAMVWFKPSGDIWATSPSRYLIQLYADSSNYYYIRLNDASNDLVLLRQSGGVSDTFSVFGASGSTNWQVAMFSVSQAANTLKKYLNGNQVGATVGTTPWTGTGLSNTSTVIGSTNVTPGSVWSGSIAHVALWDAPITSAILALATV